MSTPAIPVTLGTTARDHCDVLVVGAGMAGASLAFELAPLARVVVLEQESAPGYHATGRSVALFTEAYGPPLMRRLARASRPFLEAPPEGFAEHALLAPRGLLAIAREHELPLLEAELARTRELLPDAERLDAAGLRETLPVLAPQYVAGMRVPDGGDIDVAALQQGYLRGLRRHGGRVLTDARVVRVSREGHAWSVESRAGTFTAPLLVNAAGAWADALAAMAGVRPAGLEARRRTVFTFDPPPGVAVDGWPLVHDVAESFYFKPDAGRILASPADATPSPPVDARPEELDLALGVDRIERATTLRVPRLVSSWAGLRSFAPDGRPVLGMDPEVPGFFWLAGQGGSGIQIAPALARAAAGLIAWSTLPPELADAGISAGLLSPARLRSAAHGD